ncbi:MAG: hypothetical protein ACO4AI_07765 [Prochlorothrix sp.]
MSAMLPIVSFRILYGAPRLIVAGGEAACHNPDAVVGTAIEI